jgi:hypothetical protein
MCNKQLTANRGMLPYMPNHLLLLLLLLCVCVYQVLQPNDIFPSLTAALSSPDFSTLNSVLQHITACLNITVLDDLETSPGTMAAPLNEVGGTRQQQQQQPSAARPVAVVGFDTARCTSCLQAA